VVKVICIAAASFGPPGHGRFTCIRHVAPKRIDM